MGYEIECLITDRRWNCVDIEQIAVKALGGVFAYFDIAPAQCSVSILACDSVRGAALNQRYRAKNTATNILCWPTAALSAQDITAGALPSLPFSALGDIAITYEICAEEAAMGGKGLDAHLLHLFVHAILHLLGFDHETDTDAQIMEKNETRILENLGLPDPYRT